MSYREPAKPGLELAPEPEWVKEASVSGGIILKKVKPHTCKLPSIRDWEAEYTRFECFHCKQQWELKSHWFSRDTWEKVNA